VKRIFLAAACFFLASTVVWAQFEAGSVVGVITDPAGSVVPNASIELRSLATAAVRQASSSSSGEFDFVAVPPGRYSITVKLAGFKQKTQDFELVVGQRLELNLPMEVGAETQNVTVTSNVETIDTASSEVSNLRTEQQVVDLPLNGRNFTQLIQLAPGVNNHANASNSIQQGYTSGRGTRQKIRCTCSTVF
jgi:hypothetical protein